MAIAIQIPQTIEETLRSALPDLDERAKEIVLVGLFREGRITHHQLCSAMGLSPDQANAVLKNHGVHEDLPTAVEIAEEWTSLRRLMDSK